MVTSVLRFRACIIIIWSQNSRLAVGDLPSRVCRLQPLARRDTCTTQAGHITERAKALVQSNKATIE